MIARAIVKMSISIKGLLESRSANNYDLAQQSTWKSTRLPKPENPPPSLPPLPSRGRVCSKPRAGESQRGDPDPKAGCRVESCHRCVVMSPHSTLCVFFEEKKGKEQAHAKRCMIETHYRHLPCESEHRSSSSSHSDPTPRTRWTLFGLCWHHQVGEKQQLVVLRPHN